MRARVIHEGKKEAGVPLTRAFNKHLKAIEKSDSKNPEVQNRYGRILRAGRPGGATLSFSGDEPNALFHNTGTEFLDLGATMGIARREDGRGFVLADLDQDGALDVVLHNYFRNPIVALANRAAGGNRWIRFRLRGTTSNRFGVGARVTVGGQVQELQCGSGYLSCHPPELHYGLGAEGAVDVGVRWPSGRVDRYRALASNRTYTLVEGRPGALRSEELRPQAMKARSGKVPSRSELDVNAVLGNLKTLSGEAARVADERPRIVIFFSLTCIACKTELMRQGELEAEAARVGARLVWVTTDTDPREVERAFRLNGAPVMPFRPGTPLGPLPVPTVYLVDGPRVDRFLGRFAVTAALEDIRRRSIKR